MSRKSRHFSRLPQIHTTKRHSNVKIKSPGLCGLEWIFIHFSHLGTDRFKAGNRQDGDPSRLENRRSEGCQKPSKQAMVEGISELTSAIDRLNKNVTESKPVQPVVMIEKKRSILLSEAIKRYSKFQKSKKKWSPGTQYKNERYLNLLVKVIGDVAVNSITNTMLDEFHEALKIPSANGDIRSDPTVFEIMVKVSGLFKYLIHYSEDTGYTKANPVDTYKFGGKPQPDEPKEPFTIDDLQALFTSNEYVYDRFKHSYRFWIPIIALYSGCRVNEISQLYCSDVITDENLMWLDINGWHAGKYHRITKSEEKPKDKRVKNAQSARLVPMHPILRKLGFYQYVNDMKEQGNIRAFSELKYDPKTGYGSTVSTWFGYYKKQCGILSKTKTFHCFRKNFTDNLVALKVPPNVSDDTLGWKKKGGSVMLDHYASKMHVKDLAPYVTKVKYEGLDLSHLLKSKFARKQKKV